MAMKCDKCGCVMTLDQLEERAIRQALDEHKGNLTQTTKALGVGIPTLYRKMKEYGIPTGLKVNRPWLPVLWSQK